MKSSKKWSMCMTPLLLSPQILRDPDSSSFINLLSLNMTYSFLAFGSFFIPGCSKKERMNKKMRACPNCPSKKGAWKLPHDFLLNIPLPELSHMTPLGPKEVMFQGENCLFMEEGELNWGGIQYSKPRNWFSFVIYNLF